MTVLRELALSVAALVVFLFVSHALSGPVENERINQSISASAWIGADPLPAERWLVKDSITTGRPWTGTEPAPAARRFARAVTPARRVKEVFAQFVPGES